jgi:hypothetical protein
VKFTLGVNAFAVKLYLPEEIEISQSSLASFPRGKKKKKKKNLPFPEYFCA